MITTEMRDEQPIPFTLNGVSISGFRTDDYISWGESLISQGSDGDKTYFLADNDFTIGGIISTSYPLSTSEVRYYDAENGRCYTTDLSGDPESGGFYLLKPI